MSNNRIITTINLADYKMIDLNINQQIIFEEIGIIYLENVVITKHKRRYGGKIQQVVAAICGNDKEEIKKWAYNQKPSLFS